MIWLGNILFGTFMGRLISGLAVAWGALMINNVYQRDVGGDRRESRIIDNSNKKARERDEDIKSDIERIDEALRNSEKKRKGAPRSRGNAAFDELRRQFK